MKRILLFRAGAREKGILTAGLLGLVLLCSGGHALHASSRAQVQQYITLQIDDATVRDVLIRLQETTRHEFFYRAEDLPAEPVRNYTFTNAPIGRVMDELLSGTGLDWSNENGTIVISRKRAASTAARIPVVTGRVTDNDGNPLAGATVHCPQSGQFTISDAAGHFRMADVPGDGTLNITYIGFSAVHTSITGRDRIEVVMFPDNIELENVVVTGYQTISRERATGSFDIVSGKALDRPVAGADQLLIGKVAGLHMPQDADGNTSLTIRGQGSFGNNSPLIVVDGFPYEGDLSSIPPADIESLTVLKDAAASSIWGARAMHGVVVVVTKKAKTNSPLQVEFSSNVKVGAKTDVDYLRNMPSSAGMIEYQKGIFGNYGYTPYASVLAKNNISNVLYMTSSQAEILYNKFRNGEISEPEMNAGLDRLSKLDNTDQIHEYLLQRTVNQQYNLSFSGGNERLTSYAILTYNNGRGRLQGTKSENIDFTYRGTMSLTRWLTLSVNASVDYGKGRSSSMGEKISVSDLAPYDMLVGEDGEYTDLLHMKYYAPVIYGSVPTGMFPYEDWSFNPARELKSNRSDSESLAATILAGLRVDIIEGLTFDTQFRYYGATSSSKSYYSEDSFTTRWTVNTASTWTPGDDGHTVTPNLPAGGMLDQSRATLKNYRWRNQLTFDRVFGRHEISFVGGVEVADQQTDTNGSPRTYGYDGKFLTVGAYHNGTGSPTKLYNWLGYAQTFPYQNSFAHKTNRFFSAYGNVAYTFDSKYTLSGSVRTDAANYITDDPKKRYQPFWSAGIGWNIAREDFMQGAEWLDALSLRATYGYNGNSEVGSTSAMPLVTMNSAPNEDTGELEASISSKGNPNLRWERSGVVNIGVDFSMFNHKLSGKIDYYRKHGKDLLASVAIPLVNGDREAYYNAAEILNHGVELTLGTRMNLGGHFRWTGNLNVAYNFNKVLNYFRTEHPYWWMTGSGGTTWVEGENMNSMYSYVYGGMRNVGTEQNPKMVPVVKLGGDDYMPFNGSTTLDGKDFLENQGVTIPPFTLGMTHTFNYKTFGLTFCVVGNFGHVFRRTAFNYAAQGKYPNKGWEKVVGGDIDTNKVVPMPDKTDDMWSSSIIDYLDILTTSANNVRLQYLTLDYSLPPRLLSKIGIGNMTLYAQGNNLFTIKKTDEDPDFAYGSYRLQSSWSFGLKVRF